MKRSHLVSTTVFLLLTFFGFALELNAQYAKFDRAAGRIEIDFGSAKVKVTDVQKIYLVASGVTTAYNQSQVAQGAGSGLTSYIVSIQAPPAMPASLFTNPVQLDILVKNDPAKNDVSVISITVEEIGVVVPYAQYLKDLKTSLKESEGKDDAELYVSGDVTAAVGSKPNWVADAKYERKFAFNDFPLFVSPFFNLSYNSKASETDKLNLGVKFTKTFGFSSANKTLRVDRREQEILDNTSLSDAPAKYRLLKSSRKQRQFFQYEGTLQFESDWDFKVNNVISSQQIKYLFHPYFFRSGKVLFTPLLGAEVGRNLHNPLSPSDRGIARLKAGATLAVTTESPFGGLLGKDLVWENTFTQRWLLLKETAFDKNDDGDLIFKSFGRKPKSHFKSSLEFKFNDYFGPVLSYEWGQEPPLYELVNHKLKFGLVYSFSRTPAVP